MNYIKLIIVDGVFGYYLQCVGYVLMIWAFDRRKIHVKDFFLASILFSCVAFGIRSLDMISFGFHTILIMIIFILLGIKVFKTKAYTTALAVMMTAILVILCEIINYGFLKIWFDAETLSAIMKDDKNITGQIYKAVLGIPTNLLQIAITYVIYKFQTRKKRE